VYVNQTHPEEREDNNIYKSECGEKNKQERQDFLKYCTSVERCETAAAAGGI